jgi:multiple sugar transport system substrate-binding protein
VGFDAKITPFRDGMTNMRWNGCAGKLNHASAAVMADFVVLDMFAAAASGQKTPQAAMEEAEARALQYYKE